MQVMLLHCMCTVWALHAYFVKPTRQETPLKPPTPVYKRECSNTNKQDSVVSKCVTRLSTVA